MTSKSNGEAGSSKSESNMECCMCGDFGFSNQLFHCKICQFRSQHRYCSNLYPKADSYQICNWCLSLKEESKPNSSISSSIKNNDDQIPTFQSQLNKPIKKQRPSELSQSPLPPPPPPRRRLLPVDEKLRRTRSEEMSRRSTGIQRKVIYRNKVRRYKFLDEVST